MQAINLSVPSPGWIFKLDRKTGKLLGSSESNGLHSITVTTGGQVMTGIYPPVPNKMLWFR